LAISGGGIRSATFALGVLQALARADLLRRLDYLSTVSGGGYVGAFLGALINRQEPMEGNGPTGLERAEQDLANPRSHAMKWLRDHGRYMSPNGAGDELIAAAVYCRNLVAVHAILALPMLTLFVMAVMLRGACAIGNWECQRGWLAFGVRWNPAYVLTALLLVAFVIPLGWAYWFIMPPRKRDEPRTPPRPRPLSDNMPWITALMVALVGSIVARVKTPLGGALALVATAALVWWRLAILSASRGGSPDRVPHARSKLSRWLSRSLLAAVSLAAIGLVDSFGETMYRQLKKLDFWGPVFTGSAVAGGLALFRYAAPLIFQGPGGRRLAVPRRLLIGIVATVAAATLLVSLAAIVHMVASTANGGIDVTSLSWFFAVTLAGTMLSSRTMRFVNQSSHQAMYAARVTRAYLGASNPRRITERLETGSNITEPIEGDDLGWGQYKPYKNGGPLHIINVTMNETISGESQIEYRDRKGVHVGIGPCGLSANVRHHALWKMERCLPGESTDWITPIQRDGSAFDVFFGADRQAHPVEALNVGTWVAISGAAFTTGLGSQTSLSGSLLLGLSNIRLGYWWDSHVEPRKRTSQEASTKTWHADFNMRKLGEWTNRLLPVQSYLTQELLARFHGPLRRRWYLSDGGHFENTGAYELIRRRLPFIILCDDGQDPEYRFEDLGGLVRKARLDFGAEIRLLTRTEIDAVVHPDLHTAIGTLDEFGCARDFAAPGGSQSGERHAGSGQRRPAHALLAWVFYDGNPTPGSALLILKPSLTGDESLDVLHYREAHAGFPQESTLDQYFDEAQWESYRRLGEHIGEQVFRCVQNQVGWAPRSMRMPSAVAKAGGSLAGSPA
jgi:hypothetical protein